MRPSPAPRTTHRRRRRHNHHAIAIERHTTHTHVPYTVPGTARARRNQKFRPKSIFQCPRSLYSPILEPHPPRRRPQVPAVQTSPQTKGVWIPPCVRYMTCTRRYMTSEPQVLAWKNTAVHGIRTFSRLPTIKKQKKVSVHHDRASLAAGASQPLTCRYGTASCACQAALSKSTTMPRRPDTRWWPPVDKHPRNASRKLDPAGRLEAPTPPKPHHATGPTQIPRRSHSPCKRYPPRQTRVSPCRRQTSLRCVLSVASGCAWRVSCGPSSRERTGTLLPCHRVSTVTCLQATQAISLTGCLCPIPYSLSIRPLRWRRQSEPASERAHHRVPPCDVAPLSSTIPETQNTNSLFLGTATQNLVQEIIGSVAEQHVRQAVCRPKADVNLAIWRRRVETRQGNDFAWVHRRRGFVFHWRRGQHAAGTVLHRTCVAHEQLGRVQHFGSFKHGGDLV